MQARERRILEGYRRVVKFLVDFPAPDPQAYADPKPLLEAALEDLAKSSALEEKFRHESQGARTAVEATLRKLRQRLNKVVSIARAHRGVMPGIEKALVMPKASAPVSSQLLSAEAIRDTVAKYDPIFVKFGCPPDYRERLSAEIALVESAAETQAVLLREKAGARSAIEDAIRRGRDQLNVLDWTVREVFEGQPEVLRQWQAAKRIRLLPVRADDGSQAEGDVDPIAA